MQKENPVIKNYIYSSKKRVLKENSLDKTKNLNKEISYFYYKLSQNDIFLII